MERFQIDLLAVQETECFKQEKEQWLREGDKNYLFVHTGVRKGVGFILSQELLPIETTNFQEISPRILRLNLSQEFFFSIYCPTDKKEGATESWKNKRFFSTLQNSLSEIKKSAIITILGDFNCTLRKKHSFPPFIGQFALRENLPKDTLEKTNADLLFELVCTHKLKIVNTFQKKKIAEISTYEPIQTIKNPNKLERLLHVKDLILTNSTSIRYFVKHTQAIKHTPHHLVVYDHESIRIKRRHTTQTTRAFARPLRCVKGTQFDARLRDIDDNYPGVLENKLLLSCSPLFQQKPKEIDLDIFYKKITEAIEDTCQSFQEETFPKKSWCSSATASLCREKNKVWATYLKTRLQTQKMTYQMLNKKVKLSIAQDRRTFFAMERGKMELHQQTPRSIADNVALFYPTKVMRTNTRSPPILPLLMKAANDDPLQPAAQAMQKHLSRIYASKNFSWNSEFFEPNSEATRKIDETWKETNKTLPPFRPPMNKKAPGTDGIYLHNLFGAQKHLSKLLEIIVTQEKTPEEFKESLIFPLFKKGTKSVFDCYRTLSLRPIISNYLLRSFIPTCREITKLTVLPFQFNRPKHNCQDNLFILARIIDLCKTTRYPLFLLFTDIKKAFDSISRDFLFRVLKKRCPKALASILIFLHEKAKLTFKKLETITESGVLQGDTLAAILFVWVMDEVMREWTNKKGKEGGIKIIFRKGETLKEFLPHEWQNMSNVKVFEELIHWLGFADDIIFVGITLDDVLESFKLFKDICLSVGLEINSSKCGFMMMEWNDQTPQAIQIRTAKQIVVDAHSIPLVSEYLYLGVLISDTGTFFLHTEERGRKSIGTVLGRIKNVKSWIGKNPSLLLKELNSCFAPCLSWGTDVITLQKPEVGTLNVTFFSYLRKVFQTKFDEKTKKWQQSNKELQQLSGLKSPAETLPLARLKFFFHTLDKDTTYQSDCFLNGKLCAPQGSILPQDKRMATFSKSLLNDWKLFGVLDLSRKDASKKSFQKNILNECSHFGNSIFASVAGKGTFISEKNPDLPSIFIPQIHLFATDGSLTKTKKIKIGTFSVVDSFQSKHISEIQVTDSTSSTTLELLAIKTLLVSLQKEKVSNCSIILLSDSLSALRLMLGLDERSDELETFRETDGARKWLIENKVQEYFIHVRSHRNIPVPLNAKADFFAGSIAASRLGDAKPETEKCGTECAKQSPCSACLWNQKVNQFIREHFFGNLWLSIWQT